jgi:glyoxylase-like metal-dependent hydrolase (beta-lactamase superfamily II)
LSIDQLDLGNIRIAWLDGGAFELDGGTMFGPVPKVFWSTVYPPDQHNYIKMSAMPLLVRTSDACILIDTGLGNKLTEKQKQLFRVSQPWRLDGELSAYDLSREDIDIVIFTHCDFDHAGGGVMHNAAGLAELTFPNARYIINALEWHDARHPTARSKYVYFPENFAGIEESGRLHLVDGTQEVVPGVRVRHTGGHTRGHQIVEIEGQSGCACHLADLMPTHAHAKPGWITAHDDFPLDVTAQKEALIEKYRGRGCWFTFYHDVILKAGRMDQNGTIPA